MKLAAAIDFGKSPGCIGGGSSRCGIVIGGAGPAVGVGPPANLAISSSCTRQSLSGTLARGSPVIRNVSSLQGVAVGEGVAGSGIPKGTTVAGFWLNPNLIRLSQAAIATGADAPLVVADPCNRRYAYRMASYDANGGIGRPVAAVSIASGPARASTWNVICLTWTRPPGAVPAGYVVWKSADGGARFHFFQTANAEGSGSCRVGHNGPLWDGGQPAEARPWWVPDDPSTIPQSGQPDFLRTAIVSGAGSAAPTLAAPAASTVPPCAAHCDTALGHIAHDDTAAWRAWAARLDRRQAQGLIPARNDSGGPTRIRVAQTAQISASNVQVLAERGAEILPFGAGFAAGVLAFAGGPPKGALPLAAGLARGSNCLPAAGIRVGMWVLIETPGPGGPSQSLPYAEISRVTAASCEGAASGRRLLDPAAVTFPATTTATVGGVPAAGDRVSLTASDPFLPGPPVTVAYAVRHGDTTASIAARLAAAIGADRVLRQAGLAAASSGPVIALYTTGTAAAWTSKADHRAGGGATVTLAGAPAAIIGGKVVPGDTVRLRASGDVGCIASYKAAAGDDLTTVARGLALALDNGCANGVEATNTLNDVALVVPDALAVAWRASAVPGGAGHLTNTLATGTGAIARPLRPLTNVGVAGLRIKADDATGNMAGAALFGLSSRATAASRYQHLSLADFANGAGFYDMYNYGNLYKDIDLLAASGGTPNVTSYSDLWITYGTESRIANISSTAPLSFGPQIGSSSAMQITNLAERGAWFGRGVKLAALAGSELIDIEASSNVFDGLILCCGSSGNALVNLRADDNAYGVNPGGIVLFDAWDRNNTFTNVHAVGNVYDVATGPSDLGTAFQGVTVGALANIRNGAASRFDNVNGCPLAGSAYGPGLAPRCLRENRSAGSPQ